MADKVSPFFAVDPLDHLHVHAEVLADQLGMQHAIAIPSVFARQGDQAFPQPRVAIRSRLIGQARP